MSVCIVCVNNLLLSAADVLQVCDEGRLALMQRPLQLLKRAGDLRHGLCLPFIQLPRNLTHQLDGHRELREPARRPSMKYSPRITFQVRARHSVAHNTYGRIWANCLSFQT